MEHSNKRMNDTTSRRCGVALFAALAIGVPHAVLAESLGEDGAQKMFERADGDGDGRLSRAEYAADVQARTDDESASAQGMPATEHQAEVLVRFEERDRNGDGYLSGDELQ